MNKTIKALLDGESFNVEETFKIVNDFAITGLILNKDGKTLMSMYVNKYELLPNGECMFSQKCTGYNGTEYHLMADQIKDVEVSYSEEYGSFCIKYSLKDGTDLNLIIVNVTDMEVEPDERIEIDMYTVKDFLDEIWNGNSDYYCVMASMEDLYGLYTRLIPEHVVIETTEDDEWKLHISDDRNCIEFPVVDDSVNEFYMVYGKDRKDIIIKPFGQPFMEVELMFLKKHE